MTNKYNNDIYQYRIAQKITVWDNCYFTIEANSQEEADLKAKEVFNNDDYPDDNWSEVDYGTDELVEPENNNGEPTKELYRGPGDSELLKNNVE